jgi:CRP-like cAMP-binding protein
MMENVRTQKDGPLDRVRDLTTALFPQFAPHWDRIARYFDYRAFPAKLVLLREGDVARNLYFVLRGCMRVYLIREDGREITAQFFLEGGIVASAESFFTGEPSRAYLETLEETEALILRKDRLKPVMDVVDPSREGLVALLRNRLLYYMNLYTSFLVDPPEARYARLLEEQPLVAERVPQHYIATYLGVTPVSLSRIRARLRKKGELTKVNDVCPKSR